VFALIAAAATALLAFRGSPVEASNGKASGVAASGAGEAA
jgi:hypothetical protein